MFSLILIAFQDTRLRINMYIALDMGVNSCWPLLFFDEALWATSVPSCLFLTKYWVWPLVHAMRALRRNLLATNFYPTPTLFTSVVYEICYQISPIAVSGYFGKLYWDIWRPWLLLSRASDRNGCLIPNGIYKSWFQMPLKQIYFESKVC